MTSHANAPATRQRKRSNVIALVRQFQKLGMRPCKVECEDGAIIHFAIDLPDTDRGIEQELATLRMRKNAR